MALAALGACGIAERPKTASAPSDSFCALYEPVSYALLARAEIEAAAREGRLVRDDGNAADSDLSVAINDRNNARYDTLCGNPLGPPG